MQLLAVARGTAITVGATTNIRRACVVLELRDLRRPLRPGLVDHVAVEHRRHGDQHDQRHVDGEPHVAGAAALYLKLTPSASPGAVANALRGNATNGKVTGAGSNSPDKLLFTDY